jgi:anti-sigma factor RsiW
LYSRLGGRRLSGQTWKVIVSGHLSAQRIERYHRGELAPSELLDVGDHLAVCGACRGQMGGADQLRKAFVALGTDLEIAAYNEPAHLPPEQMAAYVDNELGEADRSMADIHLDQCAECQTELRDLSRLKTELARYVEEVTGEINYAETRPLRMLSLSRSAAGLRELKPRYLWLALASVAAALILGLSAIIWQQLDQPAMDLPPAPQVELPPLPPEEPHETPPLPNPNDKRVPRALEMAEARWDYDPDAFSGAIRIEPRRGDIPAVKIAGAYTKLLTAVPRANAEGEVYSRYRITLVATENPVWQRILGKPRGNAIDRPGVLEVALSPRIFPKAESYQLRFEGESQRGWQTLGRVALEPAGK